MKRRTLKSIACAAVMALALSVTACGGSDDAAKTEDDANVESTEDAGEEAEAGNETEAEAEPEAAEAEAGNETEAEPEAGAAGEGTYSNLEAYYNDPSVKSVLDASLGNMEQEGMSLAIDVKGNVLTMTCKFEDSSVITDDLGTTLSDALDASADQFETIVASFDEQIGESGACTFVVRYTDPDDNVLTEKEFKAQ